MPLSHPVAYSRCFIQWVPYHVYLWLALGKRWVEMRLAVVPYATCHGDLKYLRGHTHSKCLEDQRRTAAAGQD